MRLHDIIDNNSTDKNTLHSYLDTYQEKLSTRQNARNVLEIGVQRGGSIKMWHDFFPNAQIYGADIQTMEQTPNFIKGIPRITLMMGEDAYTKEFIKKLGNIRFDVIIDDGPHTADSMLFFAKYYTPLLAEGGISIIEDIPTYDWIEPIAISVPQDKRRFIQVADLRQIKGRYDDLMLIVDLNLKTNDPLTQGPR